MSFEEQLPEWNREGIEPPQSKKETGWQAGDKPPAEWLNWLFHRAYKVCKEIRDKFGQPKGFATLDDTGNVPANQLGNIDAPTAEEFNDHSARHEKGGEDEINLEDLQGKSAELKLHINESASTTEKGHVQLNDSTSSNSITQAATANAVKKVRDALDEHKAEDVTQAGGVHGLVVESGVWTPQLRGYEAGDDGNTYEIQNGTYLRIGSIVFITFEIKLSAKSPDMVNKVEIKGLPFYSKNRFSVGISFYNDINITSGIVSARTVNNVIPLYKQDSDNYETLSVSSITDTTHIQGSGLIEL